jgi:beta-N-acetylhexosaminidase
MELIIRAYEDVRDFSSIWAMWRKIFNPIWLLTPELLHRVLIDNPSYLPGDHFVAEADGKLVGFIGTQINRGEYFSRNRGGILVLMVAKSYHRRGIGRQLHEVAFEHVKKNKVQVAMLGGGSIWRIWPGIPEEMEGAIQFFCQQGWDSLSYCFDMVRSLDDYQSPQSIKERVEKQNINIHPSLPEETNAILEFEKAEFPGWFDEYHYKVACGDYRDILAAWQDGEIVGTLLMFTPKSQTLSQNLLWKQILGQNLGGMGAIGVREDRQGRGIGIALVGQGSQLLKSQGVGNSLIDWTDLDKFYSKLGYQRWRGYQFSIRSV